MFILKDFKFNVLEVFILKRLQAHSAEVRILKELGSDEWLASGESSREAKEVNEAEEVKDGKSAWGAEGQGTTKS